jgi:hypothetical protein
MTRREYDFVAYMTEWNHGIKIPPFEELKRGGIIGQTEIVGCQYWHSQCSKWHEMDLFGFYLKSSTPLDFIPCRGALSFFKPKIP